tara:strand:+ start:75 stop:539 length:465 start_codon:yes stop_codon:yes gene_type:complete
MSKDNLLLEKKFQKSVDKWVEARKQNEKGLWPIIDLDDVPSYINSPKHKALLDKMYHIEAFNKMLEDVIDDYIDQVVFMKDEELLQDRGYWIKRYALPHNPEDRKDYDMHIHTIAIELEQLRRFKEIYYERVEDEDTQNYTNLTAGAKSRITEK